MNINSLFRIKFIL